VRASGGKELVEKKGSTRLRKRHVPRSVSEEVPGTGRYYKIIIIIIIIMVSLRA